MITRRLKLLFCIILPGGLCFSAVRGAAADKPETWVEVRSPHFAVISNAGEKQARRVADQFEQVRALFQKALVNVRVDPGQPIVIFLAKNEKTLKALLPAYWEQKGHMHPAGEFMAGQERHYVALRMDAGGENPYHIIYHEYTHLIVNLNFRHLPVWLNEGYAEFFGNTTIGEKELKIGQPNRSRVLQLRESKLLPLEVLLKADHRSPYYNEANKSSLFYAQSWALVHYLTLEEQNYKTRPLNTFLRHMQSDLDEIEAARRAFGDLKQLERKLESYVRQSNFFEITMKSPAEVTDKDFVVRALSSAESAAARGDFHLHHNRTVEARALLEEALRLDPSLALAHESMGFLHYRQGEREEAKKYFDRAVQLDSRSFLAHYYHAMLAVHGSRNLESLAGAEASLERAIALNPNFAPAYSTLASFYSLRKETLEKALAAARKATELEPGEFHHYLNYGRVLLRMERVDEARAVGQAVLAAANSPDIRAAAETLLEEVKRHQEFLAERKRYDEEARASREQIQSYLQSGTGTKLAGDSATTSGPAKTPSPTAASKPRPYSMFGRIAEVSCPAPPAMDLALSLAGVVMRLRAENMFKVDYLTTAWKPPANFNPCTHLKGLSAQVSYTLAAGKSYDGEILTIEVRK